MVFVNKWGMDRRKLTCVELFKGMPSFQWLYSIPCYLPLAFRQYIWSYVHKLCKYSITVPSQFTTNVNVTFVVMKIFWRTVHILVSDDLHFHSHCPLLVTYFSLASTFTLYVGRVCIRLSLTSTVVMRQYLCSQKDTIIFYCFGIKDIFRLNSNVRYEN